MKINLSKYKTKIVEKRKMHGWKGMNKPAADKIKKDVLKPKKNEVLVSLSVKKKDRSRVARHEKIEAEEIKKKGFGYKKAHKIATRLERDKPATIKKKLKRM